MRNFTGWAIALALVGLAIALVFVGGDLDRVQAWMATPLHSATISDVLAVALIVSLFWPRGR